VKLYSINTGYFKLDGGAMFGVVPKSLWSKRHPADDNNMCSWAMRCLLIEDGNRLILIDNGMGDKQDEKFKGFYYLHGDDTLEKSLNAHGFSTNDITDNILTHLHFDHCGGGIQWNKDRTKFETTFKNATYHLSQGQWELAMNPNPREKASFLKENLIPMQESGQMKFIDYNDFDGLIQFESVNGHTEEMLIPTVDYKGHKISFMADLIPSHHHLPIAWVMGYDSQPLISMQEKTKFLTSNSSHLLFYEHDNSVELSYLTNNDGHIKFGEGLKLSDL